MRGVGRVAGASCSVRVRSGQEREGQRISSQKGPKTRDGDLFGLPDEHCWLLGCLTSAGHLESIISRTPPWRAPTTSYDDDELLETTFYHYSSPR